jgi:ABC-2 type transport system ATP-binding protein
VRALDDVSLTIRRGEVLGLLGANGAGKTTLAKIVSTLLLPTAGTVLVEGLDVERRATDVRAVTSVVFGGERGLYTRLTGRQNLEFFGMLRGLGRRALKDRAPAALAESGLADAADRRVETYSRGMKQRLHLAIGLIATPRLLLLDEPTVGLDPAEAERLRGVIGSLRDRGVTVLLTSHYLLDIERLADRVVLLHEGRVTHDMTLSEFTRQASHVAVVDVVGHGPEPTMGDTGKGSGITLVGSESTPAGWTVSLRIRRWDASSLVEVGRIVGSAAVDDIRVSPVRLEDIYTTITGSRS